MWRETYRNIQRLRVSDGVKRILLNEVNWKIVKGCVISIMGEKEKDERQRQINV